MANSCCFSLGEKLDFLDVLLNSFITSTAGRKHFEIKGEHIGLMSKTNFNIRLRWWSSGQRVRLLL